MKKTAILAISIVVFLTTTPVIAAVTLPFSDGFENYTVGSPPLSPWFGLAGGPATVTNSQFHSGSRSIYLWGGSYDSDSAVVDLGATYPDKIGYEAWVKVNSSGDGVLIGFHEQIQNMAPSFNAVCFNWYDGKVYFNSTAQFILLDSFTLGVWHKVRVEIDFGILKADIWINDVLVGDGVQALPKNTTWQLYGQTYSIQLRKIGVIHQVGTPVYVDDFSVYAWGDGGPEPPSCEKSVIKNCDFSNGLADWTFENASTTYPGCASAGMYANADASVFDGMGRIHVYSAYGTGYLRQTFQEVQPAEISFYYRTGADPAGYTPGCGRGTLFLYHGGQEVFMYTATNFTHAENSGTAARFLGELHAIRVNTSITEGTVKVTLDYSGGQVQVWVNGNLETSFSIPLGADVKVDRIELFAFNSCCDGRNNQYSLFDNIIVRGVVPCDGIAEIELVRLVNITNTPGTAEANPAWSPDGSKIVFSSGGDYTCGGGGLSLWVMNADGSSRTLLHPSVSGVNLNLTDWSPDGTRIVYCQDDINDPEIWVMNADGTNDHKLGSGSGAYRGPRWSPDGHKIVFMKRIDPYRDNIWVMDADGSNETQLTFGNLGDGWPTWSPDGEKIMFHRWSNGLMKLYIVDSDGSNLHPLTNDNMSETQASWSPDGRYIVFISPPDNNLWVMNSDGTGKKQLTTMGRAEMPRWNPTGDIIAFGSGTGCLEKDTYLAYLCVPSANKPPLADAGPDQTVSAGGACNAAVTLDGTGSTDPDGDVLSYTWTGPFGTKDGPNPSVILSLGTHSITLSVDDGKGGRASDTVQITVIDNTPPRIATPPNITVNTDPGMCSAGVTYDVTATDNCPGVTVVSNPPSASVFPKGVTTVGVTATDASGNMATGTFTVTVEDKEPPRITCPANIVIPTDPGMCSAGVTYNVGATDNCPGVAVVSNPPSGSVFPKGVTTVTSIATDASGNRATGTFTVTVEDREKPTLGLPANIVKPTDPGQCSAVVSYTVTATDNCPGMPPIIIDPPPGSVFPKGTTTVTVKATDASGNTATGTFTVTVEDKENPVITNISAIPSTLWPPNHKMVDVTVNYNVSDNCSQAPTCTLSVASNEPIDGTGDGDTSPDWVIVDAHHVKLRAERAGSGNGRIYTITTACTDASGNPSSQIVTVPVPHDQGKK